MSRRDVPKRGHGSVSTEEPRMTPADEGVAFMQSQFHAMRSRGGLGPDPDAVAGAARYMSGGDVDYDVR